VPGNTEEIHEEYQSG